MGTPTQLDSLTDREVEVLSLVAEGWSNAEIAQRLHATSVTVKIHLSRLLMKFDARARAQVIFSEDRFRRANRSLVGALGATPTRLDFAARLLDATVSERPSWPVGNMPAAWKALPLRATPFGSLSFHQVPWGSRLPANPPT